LLTATIGSAGLLIYVYFAIASHVLDKDAYGDIVVLWAGVFIVVSTLFRPVEQLLSRTVAELAVRREAIGYPLRIAGLIQVSLALLYLVVALAARGPVESNLLSGDDTLYWIMIAATVAFAGSFYARGLLAGERRFGLYAALLMIDAVTRPAMAPRLTQRKGLPIERRQDLRRHPDRRHGVAPRVPVAPVGAPQAREERERPLPRRLLRRDERLDRPGRRLRVRRAPLDQREAAARQLQAAQKGEPAPNWTRPRSHAGRPQRLNGRRRVVRV